MTTEKLNNDVEVLLAGASGLLASIPATDATLQHYVLVLAQALGASRVAISIDSPSGRQFRGDFQARSGKAPFLSYSRPVKVNEEVRGTLLIEIVTPRQDPTTMLTMLDASFQFLNLFAEYHAAKDAQVALLEEVSMLSTTLLHRKRVDRAAGFLATAKGISETQARKQIHAQAATAGRNPVHLANEIINRYSMLVPSRRPVPGSPTTASPLRKSA